MYPSPTAPHARRHRQRSRRTPMGSPLRHRVLVIAAAAVAAVLTGGPAQAHSDLESATPAVDSTVTQLPDTLELTFSDGVQPGFAQIAVLDAAGADVVTADPTVDGDVVSQPVAMTAAGDYGVSYRIVSADGHTIQGTYGFTYAPAAAPSSESSATTSEGPAAPTSAAPSGGVEGTDTEPAVETAAAQDDGGISGGVVAGLVALIALLGIGGPVLLRRRQA